MRAGALFTGCDPQRLLDAIDGLFPAHGDRVALMLPPDDKTPEDRQALLAEIVRGVIARTSGRGAAPDSTRGVLSPVEEAYAALVGRYLGQTLETRTAEHPWMAKG